MDFVSWKDRKPLASALKTIYRALDAKAAEEALAAFEAGEWGQRYPAISQSWRRAVRARGHFPCNEAGTKLLYLILNGSEKEWKMPPREWSMAKAQLAVIFGERFIKAIAA